MIKKLIIAASLLALSRANTVLAEIPLIEDIPAGCSNERSVFARVPPFTIDPTWLAPCEHFCPPGGGERTVWFPTAVCVGSVITAVKCIPDPARPGCFKVEADGSDPDNADCASNSGAGWACADRPVNAECSYRPEGDPKAPEKQYQHPTHHAYCVRTDVKKSQ